ncbi:MAG: hypothetical protein ABIC40_07335, partial [bacterium]
MKSPISIFILATAIFCILWPTRVFATTISEIIEGIGSFRSPADLNSLTFKGEIKIEFEENSGNETMNIPLDCAWRSPNDWDATYVANGEKSKWPKGTEDVHPVVDQ